MKGVIKCAKKDEIFKKFEKADGNSKETWKIINEIRGKHKARIKPSFIINEVIVEERRAIANGFNSYFTTIASKLNDCDDGILIEPSKTFNDFIGCSVESSIYLTDSSPDEIKKIICDFSSSKASDIPITLLKRCSNFLSPELAVFYNKFMHSGIFPDILKTGIVSPVY